MVENKISRPIFILGSARSGTSILTAALKSGADIPGFNEGHFLPLMSYLINENGRYFRMKSHLFKNDRHMIANIDQMAIETEIVSLFKKQCEAMHPGDVWLDKSPGTPMIRIVPYLKQAWPGARYIFAKRRGIENIASRLKKFPQVDFENHCKQWAETMEAWLFFKDQVSDSSMEIDQRDIALNPDETASRLGEFLELNAVHVTRLSEKFTNKRPQSTGGSENEKALEIGEVGWTSEQIEIFREHCGKVSIKFGYAETSDYSL